MNETAIITMYVVIDEMLKAAGHSSHVLAQVSDAEILWIGVLVAAYFQNHHERTLVVVQRMGYLSG